MSVVTLSVIYLILHSILCFLIYTGIRLNILQFSEQLMPVVFLVPFGGVLMAIAAEVNVITQRTGTRKIDLEGIHLGDEDLRLYQLEGDQNESVVPLEEAMSVNDASVRRRLMQDILRQDPNAYTELLQEARLDDDLEVTHYASTAIMELQREYELSLQKSEKELQEAPNEIEAVNHHLHNLKRYIDSGLIEEAILSFYRVRYAEVLEMKMKMEPENMEAMAEASDNYLNMGNIDEALHLAGRMIARWPGREEAWFAKLKVCQKAGDGEGIQMIIREMKIRNVYLTPHGRSVIAFWDRDSGKEDTP